MSLKIVTNSFALFLFLCLVNFSVFSQSDETVSHESRLIWNGNLKSEDDLRDVEYVKGDVVDGGSKSRAICRTFNSDLQRIFVGKVDNGFCNYGIPSKE